MMSGQYIVCWSADPDDNAPPAAPSSLANYMSYTPCAVKSVYQNAKIRIPCSTTQKWYYVHGSEDKDCDYGKVWFVISAPLGNVTGGSSTTVMLRLKWTIEFSMPALPPELTPESSIIYASAGNYFTDSSNDWKSGKYLTFKWHEGGNIVSFPSAEALHVYKCTNPFGYYESNGTLKNSFWAVCAKEQTEDAQPMLIPMKDETNAKAYAKAQSDSLLIPYYAAGPWLVPENPAWLEQITTLELDLSRHSSVTPRFVNDATFKVADSSSLQTAKVLKQLIGKGKIEPNLPAALEQLSRLSFTGVETLGAEALSVFNYQPVRADSESSSFEEVPTTSKMQ